MKRKLLFFGFLISLLFLSFSGVLAGYEGEEPYLDGAWTYVKFLEDGNFVVPDGITEFEVLVVAGGTKGVNGYYTASMVTYRAGGGGAGGLVLLEGENAYIATESIIPVVIGAGGTGGSAALGGNSSFGDIVALGGGSGRGPIFYTYPGGDSHSGPEAPLQTDEFGWGTYGAPWSENTDTFYGGGANGQGDHTPNGKTVWGVTYAAGGTPGPSCGVYPGARSTDGGANTGNGGQGGCFRYDSGVNPNVSTSGGYGGSGIVVVRYLPLYVNLISPTQDYNSTDLKVTIAWEALDDVDYYELKWDNNSAMSSYDTATFSGTNTILYLANDDWYVDVRAKLDDGNFTPWYSDVFELRHFTKNDKPAFTLPEALETTPAVDFQWSVVGEITGYDLQVYNDSELNTMVYNASNWSGSFPLEVELEEDEYWTRVRGRDNWYNGAWSDTLNFEVDLDELDFNYLYNTVNIYGGDTLNYTFTDMDANTTYTFKINRVTDAGVFVSTLSTEVVVSDGAGAGTFEYMLPSNGKYPFEVRLNENNARLMYHYVAPKPSYLYNYVAGGHREKYEDVVLAIGAGEVVYNNQSGLLHNRYMTTQSIFESGDYFLMHYNIPNPDDYNESSFMIYINDMRTGDVMEQFTAEELFNYNQGGEYASRNFIVVSTNGIRPTIVDSREMTTETDWATLNLPKGAYDYAMVELAPDTYNHSAFGESVILIGDSKLFEWTVTPSASTFTEGQKVTWTINVNTEEIWETYNQMRFYDLSSGLYYIGTSGSPYYATYPTGYLSTFTVAYDTIYSTGSSGGAVFGVKPEQTSFEYLLDEDDTWINTQNYGYIINEVITVNEATDVTDTIDEWLFDFGLGTEETKLIIAMVAMILIIIGCAIIGVPVAGMALIALAAFIAFIAIGFIPIWTVVILVIAMVLLLIRQFSGGGGDE